MPLPFPLDNLNTPDAPAVPSPDFTAGDRVNRTRQPNTTPRKKNANAFSLIELLVVIALLGILSTLLVIGIDKLKTSSKKQQTRLTLLNLQAMFAEADSVQHFSYGIGRINFNSMAPAQQQAMIKAVAMACPGNLSDGSPDRFGPIQGQPTGNRAVSYTRDFMAVLMQFPTTSAGIGKLAAGSLMTFPPTAFPSPPPAWAAGTTYNVAKADYSNDNSDQCSDNNGTYYLRTQVYADTTGLGANLYGTILSDTNGNADGAMGPPNPSYWLPQLPPAPSQGQTLPLSTPVVLDAWGNPIIFVIGGTLGNGVALNNNAVVLNSGAMIAGGNTYQQSSPDHRPFFASAGPDGDMSKGDDNMYSFEK